MVNEMLIQNVVHEVLGHFYMTNGSGWHPEVDGSYIDMTWYMQVVARGNLEKDSLNRKVC
jgi:hypothetical protein